MSTSTQIEHPEPISLSNEFEKFIDSNSFRKEYSEKMNSINDNSKNDSLESLKNQISILTQEIKLNSNSYICSLNKEINELKEKIKKLEEENDKLKQQNKKVLSKIFNLIIKISKQNEELNSLKNQLLLKENKNNDLILNDYNSTKISFNTEFSSLEILQLKKAKSSKISKLDFVKLKNKEKKEQVNIPNKMQFQNILEEENKEKNKILKLSDNAIKDFKKKYNIQKNISKSQIIKVLVDSNYDQKKASICLKLNNNPDERYL